MFLHQRRSMLFFHHAMAFDPQTVGWQATFRFVRARIAFSRERSLTISFRPAKVNTSGTLVSFRPLCGKYKPSTLAARSLFLLSQTLHGRPPAPLRFFFAELFSQDTFRVWAMLPLMVTISSPAFLETLAVEFRCLLLDRPQSATYSPSHRCSTKLPKKCSALLNNVEFYPPPSDWIVLDDKTPPDCGCPWTVCPPFVCWRDCRVGDSFCVFPPTNSNTQTGFSFSPSSMFI